MLPLLPAVIEEPWQRVIKVEPGCENKIKEAGEDAKRVLSHTPEGTIKIDPTLKNCHSEYPCGHGVEH